MQSMRKVTALWLAVALVGLPGPPLRADDSDIFGASIQPNVMILLDNSGSMAWGIPSFPYEPSTTYPPRRMCQDIREDCVKDAVYKGMGIHPSGYPRYHLYANGISDVSDVQARQALSSTGYWFGTVGGSKVNLYHGNYLNYLYCVTCLGSESRLDVAKRVLTNLLNNVEGVRFGVMTFNQSPPGGAMVGPIGTAKATMINAVNSIAPAGGTPLGGQLRDAGHYYQGIFEGYPSPIQYACQPNFVILITDGMQTDTQSSNAVQVHAGVMFAKDHADWLAGMQNVITHTIGFAMEGGEDELAQATAALQQTAQNGGGQYRTANNAAELERALQEAIRQIIEGTYAFATPVIPTTSATGSTRAYLAALQSDPARPAWKGYLKAYNRDSTGTVPVDATTGVPLDSALAWEAGAQLAAKTASSRVIKTVIGGTLQDFSTSNSNITAALLGVAAGERDKLIDFIWGVDTYDEDGDGDVTEQRAWKLGDIFHSTPVLVTPPRSPSSDSSYIAFRNAYATRTTVLIGGANDGMLHAFRESDGEELWAFIPPDLLGNLKTLTNSSAAHPFYVDGSPVVADVKIGSNWKTIVVFGERRGGRAYHALDITNAASPAYLWSFNYTTVDPKVGETWSEPVIGKVKMSDSSEKFVAFVGGGYDTAQNNSSGKAVFAIDLSNGQKLWEYYNPGSASDDRQYMNFSIPANPTAVDLNLDGFIDRVYIGDVGGQLWKFGEKDFGDPASRPKGLENWMGKRLFRAPLAGTNPPAAGEYYPAQAIYAAPIPAYDPDSNLWIYFGTGDRNHPNNDTAPNRSYGIKDDTTMDNSVATLTETNLVDITSADRTALQGWFIRLGAKEKVLASADVFNKIVYFTSFTPTITPACETGEGTAKLYAVQMITGYAALDWATGVALTVTDSSATRDKTIGTGIPSKPIMIITESGATLTTSVIAGTTSQQLPSNPAPPPDSMRRVLYWREVF